MNISENKRVVALSAVFAIAFGGIVYYGFGKTQEYAAAQNSLREISERFEGYESAQFPPTQATLKELQKAVDEVKTVNKEMQEDLNRYASYCFGDGKQISAQDFQNQLRASISKIGQLGASKGVTIGDPAADLGFGAFKNAAPVQDDVPFRSFQLKAVERVAEHIINSGATVVLDKVYCAPLPPEAAEAIKPNSRKAKPQFPLSFEMAMEVKRGALPNIVNSIVADKDFMLTITGVAGKGMETLPLIDDYVAPGAPSSQGEDVGSASSANPAENSSRVVAVRKTGNPDETARVHLNIQVLYFNPAKTK